MGCWQHWWRLGGKWIVKSITVQPDLNFKCAPTIIYVQITASDIQFWNRDIDQMRILHKHGMYPPRFTIEVNGIAATSVSRIDIDFTGLKKKVQFQIPLQPSVQHRRQSSLSSISEPRLLGIH